VKGNKKNRLGGRRGGRGAIKAGEGKDRGTFGLKQRRGRAWLSCIGGAGWTKAEHTKSQKGGKNSNGGSVGGGKGSHVK